MIKVLGKVWRNARSESLTVEFYIRVGGEWWKTNSIIIARIHKRFNLYRIFSLFATRIDFKFHKFKRSSDPWWEREFDVEDRIIHEKFGNS
jgi:hypothetical protein